MDLGTSPRASWSCEGEYSALVCDASIRRSRARTNREPRANTYVGQPPAELVPLLDETKQEADALAASAEQQSTKNKCRVEPLTVTSFSHVLEKSGPDL